MRLVIHRVTDSTLRVDGEVISSIGKGLVVYVGITTDDTIEDGKALARKLVNLRLWDNEGEDGKVKRWSKSAKDNGYEILLSISSFPFHFLLFQSVSSHYLLS